MQMFVLAVPAFLPAVVLRALLQLRVLSTANESFSNANAMPTSSSCSSPKALGMESGKLPDEWLFASSSFHAHSLGPHNARIRSDKGGGAWCPREQIKADSYEFIQVDFPASYEILGVEVQGRHANGSGREWAEALVIDFLSERWDGTNWTRYDNGKQEEQILLANRDQHSAVLIPLNPPLFAVSLRLVPFSAQLRTVCLRFELYGCATAAAEGIKAKQSVVHGPDHHLPPHHGQAVHGGGAVSFMSPLSLVLLLLLVPSSFVLFLLLLLLLFRALRSLFRRAVSADQKGLFGSSVGGSPPLLPSSSWQNVRLPFDTANAKVYSPSFCRFDTVSLGWPPSVRSSPALPPETDNWEEEQNQQKTNIYYYGGHQQQDENEEQMQPLQNEVTRSRSLYAATRIGTPTKAADKIPVRPVRFCQLAHSCSQPDSLRAVTRPLCQKPVPMPRRATPNLAGRN